MKRNFEIIKTPEGALAWIYLFSENQITDVPIHWHQSVELTYISHGEASYSINGIHQIFKEDDLLIINSGILHGCNVKLGHAEAITIMYPDSFFAQFEKNKDTPLFRLDNTVSEYSTLKEQCKRLHGVFSKRKNDKFAQLILNSMACEIAYLLLSSFRWEELELGAIKSQKNYERCRKLVDYIDSHYRENITMKSTSNAFSISREHLARFFRKNMGTTFKKYLTRVRLFHAYKMITNSDYSLVHIAMECGFSDSRSLITSFKKIYGTTPGRYRKEYFQNINEYFQSSQRVDYFDE